MKDYEPLDLGPLCNAGAALYGPEATPPTGRTLLHGLPFLIGGEAPDPARCFVALGPGGAEAPLAVAVGATARHLLFAHALLDSRILQGGPVGDVVAHYSVRYADGEQVSVPVRERFEIAAIPMWWSAYPFLAVPDQKDSLMPRYEGRFSAAGERQAEADQGWPEYFYLWDWANPRPEEPIAEVQLEPAGRRVVVAAITLGQLDEQPLRRMPKRPVAITLMRPEDATRRFDLAVEVDRGVATFPFALPEAGAEAFLADPFRGFGERQNEHNSPAYTEVAAIPSATVTVKSGAETLAEAPWGELQRAGALETPRARLEVVDRGRNWVRVTVVDDESGQPIPCRVHFRSPEGIPYQPHGHHHHVNSNLGTWHVDVGGDLRLGQVTYAYIDGHCEGWLPRGEVLVDVARGPEYEPLRQRITIAPGQQELELRLRRWTNMNARRWFSGDTHVHFLGSGGAHREAQAEDLNIVNLLQSQWGHLFTNTEDALGATFSNGGRTIVYTSQENRQHLLGHLTLLGLKTPVMPWCSDGPAEAELGGTLEITMAHWADACHAQGGTVVIPHLPNPNGEPAALIATGRADAVEMIDASDYKHNEYYRYLNCGYRLPLVGGTDKMDSAVPVGLYRTYASIPDEEFSYDAWCRAVRAGRTFLSAGPILSFSVEGAQIGDTLSISSAGTLEVEATAESVLPIHTLEIVMGGRVVAATEEPKGARRLTLRARVAVEGNTWLAARVGGPRYYEMARFFDCWQRGMFAHTSPIYVAVGGPWQLFDLATARYMLTLIDGSLSYIRHTAAHDPPGTATHHHGEADHLAFLERPFHEAAAAIHRRMHELGIAH
ncbi:MAG TPA: CehA/McbA family metallohydrolase [Roseiflexaceae bacterium]|nr:CehA/McbA family metallohydrolase [Roseiflexaceae bacterium]